MYFTEENVGDIFIHGLSILNFTNVFRLQITMSFLSEIAGFSKSRLKTTSTTVTTMGGRQYLETRDKYGRSSRTLLTEGEDLMYIGDTKPDLQVGDVIPGLLVGEPSWILKLLCSYFGAVDWEIIPLVFGGCMKMFANKLSWLMICDTVKHDWFLRIKPVY